MNVAAEEITQRKRAEEELRRREEHIQVILGELAHRTKNLLVVVMALAKQSARNATDVRHYQAVFTEAGGLTAGNDVKFAGVKVGTVDDVSLSHGKALVRFTVDS